MYENADAILCPPVTQNTVESRKPPEVRRFNRTHSGNAELFAQLFRDKARYDHAQKRWLIWAKHWWEPDDKNGIAALAKHIARWRAAAAFKEVEDPDEFKWALKSESRYGIEATLKLAQSEPPIADNGRDWDVDPMLFGVQNGVVDLKTGTLRPGSRSDRITLHSAIEFNAGATCSRFRQFLQEIFW